MYIHDMEELAAKRGIERGKAEMARSLLARSERSDNVYDYEKVIADLNTMIPAIHQNAVDHGWWEGDRSFWEIYSLFHSELSEALEEYRNGEPVIYCNQRGGDWCPNCCGDTCAVVPDVTCPECFKQRKESGKVPNKPEGVLVELADVVIRILDYLGKEGMQLKVIEEELAKAEGAGLGDRIAVLHCALSVAWLQKKTHGDAAADYDELTLLSAVVKEIAAYTAELKCDLPEIAALKHAYNVTRPYKHGGKVI